MLRLNKIWFAVLVVASFGTVSLLHNVDASAHVYQNPKQYYQISDKQIEPVGKVGYTVKVGYEGIKTLKIMRRLGINMGPIGTVTMNTTTLLN